MHFARVGDHLGMHFASVGTILECMSLTATWNWSENAPETDQILRLQLFTGDVQGISLTLLQYIGLLDRCAVSRHDEQLAF